MATRIAGRKLLDGLLKRSESALSCAVRGLWPLLSAGMARAARGQTTPAWAPAPLGVEPSPPELELPRSTDSLCPDCIKRLRREIADGKWDRTTLASGAPGQIPATIRERDGRVIIEKDCPEHGHFEETLSVDVAFQRRIESLFFGRDFASPASSLRQHGTSSVKYGRGAVLTVDLTNRCNMMCDACFMDANQVGYVHEKDWTTIQKILDDSLTVVPRRQMSVQFSGGEPTLSPFFLDAIEYARKVGYFCVQCASNGIRFAQDLDFCHAAKRAGLRLCYLQFDGTSNEAHAPRRVANLFEVKERAIENLHAAGIDVVLVVTVARGVNDHEVGKIVQFAIDHADKITVVSFQPISFTGRAEELSDAERARQRYTTSHLVHDMKSQLGATEPLRDWFPLGAMNPFSDVVDLMANPMETLGALKCGCHPNCGVGTVLLVHKKTGRYIPLAELVDIEALLRDIRQIGRWQRGRLPTQLALALAVVKAFRSTAAPDDYGLLQLIRQMISQIGARGGRVGASEGDAAEFPWRFLFVAGMWFQDLWTYDFRRTEMCIIPYGTEEGEISFCAYNTGVGWRQLIEQQYQSASLADWYRTKGRHPVYAKGQSLPLPEAESEAEDEPDSRRLAQRRKLKLVS